MFPAQHKHRLRAIVGAIKVAIDSRVDMVIVEWMLQNPPTHGIADCGVIIARKGQAK